MQKLTPFLAFQDDAEEAVDFYLSVFPHATKTPGLPGPNGKPLTISFNLEGLDFVALNAAFADPFNDRISFFIRCKDQPEIDHYWTALTAGGGAEIACGWLKDRFGVRWQVVPENIMELLRPPAAMQAMMLMKKLDIAALEAAGAQEA